MWHTEMSPAELGEWLVFVLAVFWWAAYWRLAWKYGSPAGPSYAKMLFPIALFFGSLWPAHTETIRLKLIFGMAVIVLLSWFVGSF